MSGFLLSLAVFLALCGIVELVQACREDNSGWAGIFHLLYAMVAIVGSILLFEDRWQ